MDVSVATGSEGGRLRGRGHVGGSHTPGRSQLLITRFPSGADTDSMPAHLVKTDERSNGHDGELTFQAFCTALRGQEVGSEASKEAQNPPKCVAYAATRCL
jgi:hypothetical protein